MAVQDIYIYGEVGKQVTLDTVLKDITPKASSYTVHIHSNGGDVFEGYAIYNALKNTGKNIIVHVEGTCASIATLIASAGNKIIMNTKSAWMIHSPRIASMSGTSKDLRNVAGQLDKIENQLIDSWVGRTNLTREQLAVMYDQETWLTPEQAVEMGFADEVQEVLKAVASADLKKYKYMEDRKTLLGTIKNMIDTFLNPEKIKNVTDTLADGTVVQVPEEGDWVGKPVTLESGEPLSPGEHTLASGKVIVIGEDGLVMTVTEPEAKLEQEPTNSEEDMKLKEENERLKAELEQLKSALAVSNSQNEKIEAKAKSFENKYTNDLKAIQDKLAKLETTTVGDTTPPDKGVKNTFNPGQPVLNDPMKELFGKAIIDRRK